jgi:general secretion pathway protein G
MTKNDMIKMGIVVGIVAGAILFGLQQFPKIRQRWGQFQGQVGEGKVTVTKATLRQLHTALNQFHMDTGRWPTEAEGLSVLVRKPTDVTNWPAGGYLEQPKVPKDGWGNDFIYETGRPFVIKSLGADGRAGGSGFDADLLSTDF